MKFSEFTRQFVNMNDKEQLKQLMKGNMKNQNKKEIIAQMRSLQEANENLIKLASHKKSLETDRHPKYGENKPRRFSNAMMETNISPV